MEESEVAEECGDEDRRDPIADEVPEHFPEGLAVFGFTASSVFDLNQGARGNHNRPRDGRSRAPHCGVLASGHPVYPKGPLFSDEMAVGLQEHPAIVGLGDAEEVDGPLGRPPGFELVPNSVTLARFPGNGWLPPSITKQEPCLLEKLRWHGSC